MAPHSVSGWCDLRMADRSRVLAASGVQRPGSQQPAIVVRIRIGRPITAAHQSIGVIGRGLQRVALRARLPVLPIRTRLPLRTSRTRLTLRSRRSSRTSRARGADGSGLARCSRHSARAWRARTPVVALLPGRPGRAGRTGRPGIALVAIEPGRPGHRVARLATAPRRPCNRCCSQPLHLACKRVDDRTVRTAVLRHVHHEESEGCEHAQREDARHRAEPLCARQRPPLSVCGLHFATTAHTAIAAESRPISTGVIIW